MHLAFTIIFAIILITAIICIHVFRKYKQEYLKTIEEKQISLKFLLGFSAFCIDSMYKFPPFKSSGFYNKTKKLIASVNVGTSPDKSVYIHHLQLMSYIIVILLITSFLGFVYTLSLSGTDNNTIDVVTRPSIGEGSQSISITTDSELYSGVIDITVEDKKYTFDEVMKIFSDNRSSFDTHVLNDNISFLHIDSPLNLPNMWGDENISVSWFINEPDIIDYTGDLIGDNIVSSGVSVELVATLTLNDISADICYQLIVFPPKISDKDIVEEYLDKFINSEQKRTQDVVELPDNILGFDISYSNSKEVYPPVGIYNCRTLYFSYCNYS